MITCEQYLAEVVRYAQMDLKLAVACAVGSFVVFLGAFIYGQIHSWKSVEHISVFLAGIVAICAGAMALLFGGIAVSSYERIQVPLSEPNAAYYCAPHPPLYLEKAE